jgi:hypothetical protein
MLNVILAPTDELAHTVENVKLSVEAEYGSIVVEGSQYTSAHHAGEYAVECPAPCNDVTIPVIEEGNILVSHLDLDTFGGCLRGMGQHPEIFASEHDAFWTLAEYVDLNGPHRMSQADAARADALRLYAFWAWERGNVPRLSRTEIHDVTETVVAAGHALAKILSGDEELLAAGEKFWVAQEELSKQTFQRIDGKVLVRTTRSEFCNHLYEVPGKPGTIHDAVVAFCEDQKSITISLADPGDLSCCTIVQELWGPKAGGHPGCAGGPRGLEMGDTEVQAVVDAMNTALS